MTPLDASLYRDLVHRALVEDVGYGDRTTEAIVPAEARARGTLVARSDCVVAGLDVAAAVFADIDAAARLRQVARDGDGCQRGAALAVVEGPARALLSGERTALNFLQRMSGIATLTRRFV